LAQVIKELSQINVQAYYQPILFIQKKIKDQSNLNSKARRKNIESAYRVNGSVISQSPTILVDDLITTGSSIQEALRALRDAKITIDAVITACAVGRNSLIR
jgi:predicted amidophosphoribosyltransferase